MISQVIQSVSHTISSNFASFSNANIFLRNSVTLSPSLLSTIMKVILAVGAGVIVANAQAAQFDIPTANSDLCKSVEPYKTMRQIIVNPLTLDHPDLENATYNLQEIENPFNHVIGGHSFTGNYQLHFKKGEIKSEIRGKFKNQIFQEGTLRFNPEDQNPNCIFLERGTFDSDGQLHGKGERSFPGESWKGKFKHGQLINGAKLYSAEENPVLRINGPFNENGQFSVTEDNYSHGQIIYRDKMYIQGYFKDNLFQEGHVCCCSDPKCHTYGNCTYRKNTEKPVSVSEIRQKFQNKCEEPILYKGKEFTMSNLYEF